MIKVLEMWDKISFCVKVQVQQKLIYGFWVQYNVLLPMSVFIYILCTLLDHYTYIQYYRKEAGFFLDNLLTESQPPQKMGSTAQITVRAKWVGKCVLVVSLEFSNCFIFWLHTLVEMYVETETLSVSMYADSRYADACVQE